MIQKQCLYLTVSRIPALSQTAPRAMVYDSVTVRLGAGIEYLFHTPRVRYASVGDRFGDNAVHDPARLDYQDAFGFFSALSVGVAF